MPLILFETGDLRPYHSSCTCVLRHQAPTRSRLFRTKVPLVKIALPKLMWQSLAEPIKITTAFLHSVPLHHRQRTHPPFNDCVRHGLETRILSYGKAPSSQEPHVPNHPMMSFCGC